MPFKRTTFPTETKIGIHLEELKQCTEVGIFLLLEGSQVRKSNMFENAGLYPERIGENDNLMHFHAIAPDIRSSGEPENILTTNYR